MKRVLKKKEKALTFVMATLIAIAFSAPAQARESASLGDIPTDALQSLTSLGLDEEEAAQQYMQLVDQEQSDLLALETMGIKPLPDELAAVNSSQRETADTRANGTEYGTYPRFAGAILVTTEKAFGLINTGHAAIVYNSNYAIEAMGSSVNKVRVISNNWNNKPARVYAAYVKYLSENQMTQAANKAASWLGRPYNYDFTNYTTRTKFYCSQLV